MAPLLQFRSWVSTEGSSFDGGNLNWLAGFFYFNEELQADTFSYDTLGGNVQDGYSFQIQDSDSWALFGSIEYLMGENI